MAVSNWARIEKQIFACADLNKANEQRIEKLRTEIQGLKNENRSLLQVMAKYPEQSNDVNETMNTNDSRIKELQQKAEEYVSVKNGRPAKMR